MKSFCNVPKSRGQAAAGEVEANKREVLVSIHLLSDKTHLHANIKLMWHERYPKDTGGGTHTRRIFTFYTRKRNEKFTLK